MNPFLRDNYSDSYIFKKNCFIYIKLKDKWRKKSKTYFKITN